MPGTFLHFLISSPRHHACFVLGAIQHLEKLVTWVTRKAPTFRSRPHLRSIRHHGMNHDNLGICPHIYYLFTSDELGTTTGTAASTTSLTHYGRGLPSTSALQAQRSWLLSSCFYATPSPKEWHVLQATSGQGGIHTYVSPAPDRISTWSGLIQHTAYATSARA